MQPDISVLIPAHNEQSRLAPTVEAISRARRTDARVEFVIVDDASSDGCVENLISAMPRLLEEPRIDIRVCPLADQVGIYEARNQAAALAQADVLFMTDGHVEFSDGWDEVVLENIRSDRVIAATSTQAGTNFRAHGCRLLVPVMGTKWNREPIRGLTPVHVAACHATVLTRELFERLGGYDAGMLLYGAGEPEFSIRAWLHGAEVVAIDGLEVRHRFKQDRELSNFLSSVLPTWIHNCLRFGLLYLSERGCLQLLRHYARISPYFETAIRMIDQSDVWERRGLLERQRVRSFEWFVHTHGLLNQAGGPII